MDLFRHKILPSNPANRVYFPVMTGQIQKSPKTKINLHNVWKKLGNTWILKGVSLEVREGEPILIIGANGSGKTTLLRLIAGLTKPTKGEISIVCKTRTCIGLSGHYPSLYPNLTVEENIRFFTLLHGLEDPGETALAAWDAFGLDKYRQALVSELSYGWRKRTDIVRCLAGDPEVILLDEPFSGLDSSTAATLSSLIKDLIDRSKTVIATTPRMDEQYSSINWNIYSLRGGLLAKR